MRPLPISVLIIARNEAHNLPRVLCSVQGWVGETIVILNNCTDNSAEVAREHGARIEYSPWLGYRDTKNAALCHVTQPWVLALDADEEVSPALRDAIQAFFHGGSDAFAAARFPRKVWFIDRWIRHGDWYPDCSLRLFRRDRARWGGSVHVHEKIEVSGPVATLPGDLHHFSFPTINSHVAKITIFADLFLKQQLDRGARFSAGAAVFRPFWRFFRAYVLRRGFLDGYPGFYIAWATAFSTFVRYSRLYEHKTRAEPRRKNE